MSDKSIEAQLDEVYDLIEDLVEAGRFAEINEILSGLDVEALESSVVYAYMILTSRFNHKLPAYSDFYFQATQVLKRNGFKDKRVLDCHSPDMVNRTEVENVRPDGWDGTIYTDGGKRTINVSVSSISALMERVRGLRK